MKIVRNLDAVEKIENCVLTTGTYDGLHLGHQSIIKKLTQVANANGACSTVVTFEPHPQFVVKSKKDNKLKLLTTLEEKISIFEQLDLDRLIIVPFTEEFSKLSSEQFIEDILINKIGFNKIIIGYDHAFGKNREGNFKILEKLSNMHSFSIIRMDAFPKNGVVVSSTKIRKLLTQGNVNQAARFLGRNYQLKGKIILGEGRGHIFKIPTANLEPLSPKKMIPARGIYAGWVEYSNKIYKAVIYIGTKPTFDYDKLSIEVFIFDFTGQLYGEHLTIQFEQKIRDDKKFNTAENLYKQIELDKQQTLEILEKMQHKLGE